MAAEIKLFPWRRYLAMVEVGLKFIWELPPYIDHECKPARPRKRSSSFRQKPGFDRDPVLVYAPWATILGIMWASYRIDYLGAPISFAIDQGRSLGMTEAQGATLIGRLRK